MRVEGSGSDDETKSFSFSFEATEIEVHGAVERVSCELSKTGMSNDQQSSVRIVLTEAINNIVEHAYANMERGAIDLSCRASGASLVVQLSDIGTPFPGNQIPEPTRTDLSGSPDDLPEGGFGWVLIRELASGITYQRVGGRNLLTLTFDLADPT